MNDGLVPITDSTGAHVSETDPEPEPGSVVLTHGEWGTAWQRHFKDGLWHRVGGGRARTWEWLIQQRNLVLCYEAATREEART